VPLLSLAPRRYVLLVVDDRARSITTRLKCSALAAEVVTCASPEQACSALVTGRRYSAVVTHAAAPGLAAMAARAATPILSVGRGLPPGALASALATVATEVPQADAEVPSGSGVGPEPTLGSFPGRPGPAGRLVAVCGPGGTGSSSVAAALAAAWGSEPAARPQAPAAPPVPPAGGGRARVLLADMALHADQAFLHGLDQPPSGLLQLVEVGRYRPVTAVDVGRHTIAASGGRLLPGLRRPGHWTAITPAAFDEVLTGLRGLFDLVVADITGDFEGEADGGSMDVEERNHMSRRTAASADVVVVVGRPGANGARRLTQLVNDLLDLGVDPARIQPLANRRLCGLPAAPIVLPVTGGGPGGLLPPGAAQPLVGAVAGMLARSPSPHRRPSLVAVTPGSLGCAAP
jgi:hypothetical protein